MKGKRQKKGPKNNMIEASIEGSINEKYDAGSHLSSQNFSQNRQISGSTKAGKSSKNSLSNQKEDKKKDTVVQ